MLKLVQGFSRAHQVFDMAAVARECGTVVSAVMLGAVAGSGLFPFKREDYEEVVKSGGKGTEASLRGFARAFEVVAQGQQQAKFVEQILKADALDSRLRGNDGAVKPAGAGRNCAAPASAAARAAGGVRRATTCAARSGARRGTGRRRRPRTGC